MLRSMERKFARASTSPCQLFDHFTTRSNVWMWWQGSGLGTGQGTGQGCWQGHWKRKGQGARRTPPPTVLITPAQTDALVARAAPAESIDSVVRKSRKLGLEMRKQFMTFPDGASDHDQEDARAMVVASTFAERTALKDPVMSALAASVIPIGVLHRESTEDASARLVP